MRRCSTARGRRGSRRVAFGSDGATDGEFCLTAPGINPATTAAVVSADCNPAFANTQGIAWLYLPGTQCGPGQFEVITQVSGVSSHTVDFNIIVP